MYYVCIYNIYIDIPKIYVKHVTEILFLLFIVIEREHVGTQTTLTREHESTQDKLEREHISTQGTLAHEHVSTEGTLSREYVSRKDTLAREQVSMQDMLAREHVIEVLNQKSKLIPIILSTSQMYH